MTNEHNPIALRINYLQNEWVKHRLQKPDARIIRWFIEENDLPLVNGFYKLESSPFGKMDELLVVMLSDFESTQTYSYHIAHDWLQQFEKDLKAFPTLNWPEYESLKEEFDELSQLDMSSSDTFLAKMIHSFKKSLAPDRKLFIGIVPRKVYSHDEMNQWIGASLELFDEEIGVVLTDYKNAPYHDDLFQNEKWKDLSNTIDLKDQDIKGAYEKLMTQGNPNDPQIGFRKCMLAMAEAASKHQKKGVYQWGEKALEIAQSTGDKAFWASAHIVFAGNLFYFQDTPKIFELLNKGIKIARSKTIDAAMDGVLIQLYAFKASYYSVIKMPEKAIETFKLQAQLAVEKDQTMAAITAYKNALVIAIQENWIEILPELSQEAFATGYVLEDDYLKATEFAFIANQYLQNNTNLEKEKIKNIEKRLEVLFGMDWKANSNIQIPGAKTQATH